MQARRNGMWRIQISKYSTTTSTRVKIPQQSDPTHPGMSDSDFGHYLAGLIEGDGYFGNRLEIIYHESDEEYANIIKTKIGYGSIYKVKDKRAIVGSEVGYARIKDLVDGKFVGNYKVNQYNTNNLRLVPGTGKVTLGNS